MCCKKTKEMETLVKNVLHENAIGRLQYKCFTCDKNNYDRDGSVN